MYLTKQNAEMYVGKTLRCNGIGLFHYYPLTVKQRNDGSFYYVDKTGTAMPVPDEKDSFNSVYFDYVETAVAAPEQAIADDGPIKPGNLSEVMA